MRSLVGVLRADAKRVTRDPFLLLMLTYPWLIALLLQRVLPWLNRYFAGRFAFSDYYPIAACLLAVLVPNSMGIVLGFQLLEEKDEGSLVAVAVTPLSLGQYFIYRATLYALVATPLVVILHQLLGVVSVPLGGLVLVAVAGLPTAPFMALLIAGFANNQVEGFAVMKGTGFLIMAPLASYFIPRPWDLLVGVVPVFWPIKIYFALVDGSTDLFWLAFVLSLVYPSLCVLWLYRRFRNRAVAAS